MSARGAALRILHQLHKGRIERVADAMADERLPPRDAALLGDLVNGVVRNERFLDFVLAGIVDRGLPSDPKLLCALRLGAFQLLLLPGMPQRAAVHETVELVRSNRAFVNAVLRRLADRVADRAADVALADTEVALGPERVLQLTPPGLAAAADRVALRHSLPDWLVARWRERHGVAIAEQIAAAASARPAIFLRACGGRSSADLIAELQREDVRCSATAVPGVVRCDSGAPLGTEAFAAGWFVVQDPTAVRAARAVAAAPGATIVDLCAAPGTKTMLLAEGVRPGGAVFAWDVDARRRARIVENARRLGLVDVVTVVDDPAQLPRADAVLVDVPCSNTGVLARRVEVRRRIVPATLGDLAATQRALLEQAIDLAAPHAPVVYSTCSIESEENDEVVDAVAAARGLRVVAKELTLPATRTCDGGFFAILQRSTGDAADA